MDFFELIQNRESIRNYDPNQPINQAMLTKILAAGRLAPSAANRQPWRFLIISSKEMLDKIHQCYDQDWFKQAPHVLVVIGDRSQSWTRVDGYNSLETDLTIAMDHLILAATSLGIATCWIANFEPKILHATLSLKDNEKVFAITPLGYPNKDFIKKQSKIRKPLNEIIKII